jgi:hypothetical protein
MLRKTVLALVAISFPAAALAHLCNDVFVQARDSLAVKVDVRDGQLRIGEKASFRVYLLNTMDRDIVTIGLEVRTGGKFQATVRPSPTWKRAPHLRTVRRGGKKEYFEVTLTRKPGVPDGKYKIDLHLFNPRKKSMVFKTVDLGRAAGICEVPKAAGIKVDGQASATEWGQSLLCTGFYEYKRTSLKWQGRSFRKYSGKVPAQAQARFRVAADEQNLYLCLGFQGAAGASSDTATFYAAKDLDSKPVKLSVDRLSGKVTCDAGSDGVECKVSPDKSQVELKVPRKLLGLAGAKGFYANFTRRAGSGSKSLETYWRGTKHSAANPVEFAHFKLAE